MWQLGPLRLDSRNFTLSRAGELIEVQRRPLDLLSFLVSERNRVVSRERLIQAVWAGVRVSDGAVDQAVYAARMAIGDLERKRGERWIETVRGRGLRFQGPVEAIAASARILDSIPAVGREEIVSVLRRALARTSRSRGGVHLIEGPAGMGKTRVVREFTAAAADQATIHTIHCEADAPAYFVADELFSSLDDELHEVAGPVHDQRAPAHVETVMRVGDRLHKAARVHPRIIVLEDLHWADGPSIALLESIAPRLDEQRVLVLGTFRSDENGASALARFFGMHAVDHHVLSPLGIADVFQLTTAIVGRPTSPDLAGAILHQSGGIPLYVRLMAERVAATGELPSIARDLGHSLFGPRLNELDPRHRALLSVAALCGESFDLWLVEVAAEGEIDTDRDWVTAALDADLIRSDPEKPLRYSFRHALLRDAVAGTLQEREAAFWHNRLAEGLVRQHAGAEGRVLSRIARHYSRGALASRSAARPFEYLVRAARVAAGRHAWGDVREHCRHALALLPALPRSAWRDDQELELHLLLAAALSSRADRTEPTREALGCARKLLDEHPDPTREAIWLSFDLARARADGDHERARASADRVDALDVLDEIPENWRRSLDALAGDPNAALKPVGSLANGLCGRRDLLHFVHRTSRDPWVERFAFTALSAWSAGFDAEACRRSQAAIDWAEGNGDVRGLVWALFLGFYLHEGRRDWDAALRVASRIDPLCEQHALPAWWGSGTGFSMWAVCRRSCDEMFPAARMASIVFERAHSEDTSFRTALYLVSARGYSWAREVGRAARTLDSGLRFCRETDERMLLPEILRHRACVAFESGDGELGSRLLGEAATIARRQRAATFEIRALADLEARDESNSNQSRRLDRLIANFGNTIGERELARTRARRAGQLPGIRPDCKIDDG